MKYFWLLNIFIVFFWNIFFKYYYFLCIFYISIFVDLWCLKNQKNDSFKIISLISTEFGK